VSVHNPLGAGLARTDSRITACARQATTGGPVPVSIRARLNLMLGVMTVLGVAISCGWAGWIGSSQALDEVQAQARQRMAVAQAVRQFSETELRELLSADPLRFHAASQPSFAANTVLAYLHQDDPGADYREVALDPVRSQFRALGWEKTAIEAFRADPALTVLQAREGVGAAERWWLARPLRAEASCLACHGGAAQRPQAMAEIYGREHSLGWQPGQVIGAQVVSVPMAPAWARVRAGLWRTLALSLSIMGLFFVLLNFGLYRVVVLPLQAHSDSWRRLASQDMLTGLANRREFGKRADLAMRWARREQQPLSVVVLDLDHFKALNDRFGHAEGDAVLHALGQVLQEAIRPLDLPARMGGEEFAILVPGCTLDSAQRFAELLRYKVEFTVFPKGLAVTASLGVAQWRPGEPFSAVLERADQALYQAKSAGRNTVRAAA